MRRPLLFRVSSALGGPYPGCARGPLILSANTRGGGDRALRRRVRPGPLLRPRSDLSYADAVVDLNRRIRQTTAMLARRNLPFIAIGGDHSSAMGIWGGVQQGMRQDARLGLLWIDAHLDANTVATSPSGMLHGMPVAGLLGVEDALLKQICRDQPALSPEQVCIVGVRSYEAEEHALLRELGVRLFPMRQIRRRGLTRVLRQAVRHLARHSDRLGISIDLDAVDPVDCPGVATRVKGGIRGRELAAALGSIPAPVAMEIAEYDPIRDQGGRSLRLIRQLVLAVAQPNSIPYRSFGSFGRAMK